MGKLKDITGQRFGRLVVIKKVENSKCGAARWLCQCDCGNSIIAWGKSLRTQATKSCGCLRADINSLVHTKHRSHYKRLYSIWLSIKTRTSNEKVDNSKYYVEKGITVCDEWKNSFESFRDWSLENGYQDDLTIDRIDANGNYCPENCRWTTWTVQGRNRTNNHKIIFRDKVYNSISEFAEELNINERTVRGRIQLGWTPEEIATIPVGMTRSQYYNKTNTN